jgi:hypothetical protein
MINVEEACCYARNISHYVRNFLDMHDTSHLMCAITDICAPFSINVRTRFFELFMSETRSEPCSKTKKEERIVMRSSSVNQLLL